VLLEHAALEQDDGLRSIQRLNLAGVEVAEPNDLGGGRRGGQQETENGNERSFHAEVYGLRRPHRESLDVPLSQRRPPLVGVHGGPKLSSRQTAEGFWRISLRLHRVFQKQTLISQISLISLSSLMHADQRMESICEICEISAICVSFWEIRDVWPLYREGRVLDSLRSLGMTHATGIPDVPH
jgi:hypothetical protein